MTDESESQQAIAQYEAAQAQLQAIDGHLARLEEMLQEQQRAASTLTSLDDDQEALVPVGAGLHVRARIIGDAPVVTPVGAGYATDLDLDGARAALERRIEETRQAMSEANAKADEVARTLQALGQRLQSMQPAPSA